MKFSKSISKGIAVAIVLSLASCVSDVLRIDNPVSASFTATLSDFPTKTVTDGWRTSWSSKDTVSVFVTRSSSSDYNYGHSLFACNGNSTFNGTLNSKFASPYNWFVIYPSGSYSSTSKSVDVSVTHPRNQTQTGTSNSHISGSNAPMYGFAFGIKDNPEIQMHQLSSVIDFKIKNGTKSDVRVVGISFMTPSYITGKFSSTVNLNNLSEESAPSWTSSSSSSYKDLTLNIENGSSIPAGSVGDYYAAIHPISAEGDYTIEVTAVSEGKVWVARKTVSAKVSFTAGKYKTVSFTFENPEPKEVTNIENARLKQYLDKLEASPYFRSYDFVAYNSTLYNNTLMTSDLYSDNSSTNRLDIPSPVQLFWDGEANSLEIYEEETKTSKFITMTFDKSESAQVYNLIPGKQYWYTARNNGSVVSEGSITPTGRRRMMKVGSKFSKEYAINCRDFGGLPVMNGGTVRYGLIYRGSSIDKLKEDSQMREVFLDVMKITLDVDLRDADQKKGNVQDFTEYGIPRTPQDYRWNTTDDLRDPVKVSATLDSVMTHVLADRPVYLHCSIGSDRTGYFSMLIESLIGVSQNYTDSDYEITSFASSQTEGNRLRTEKVSASGRQFKNGLKFLGDFNGSTLSQKVYDYVVTSENGLKMDKDKVDAFIEKMIDKD